MRRRIDLMKWQQEETQREQREEAQRRNIESSRSRRISWKADQIDPYELKKRQVKVQKSRPPRRMSEIYESDKIGNIQPAGGGYAVGAVIGILNARSKRHKDKTRIAFREKEPYIDPHELKRNRKRRCSIWSCPSIYDIAGDD